MTVTVTVSIDDVDPATAGTDFKAVKTKVLTFKAGQWQKAVAIPVLPDVAVETDETISVTLTNADSGLVIGRSVGTVTILNDD